MLLRINKPNISKSFAIFYLKIQMWLNGVYNTKYTAKNQDKIIMTIYSFTVLQKSKEHKII